MLGTILVVVVILMLLGMLPTWPHSRQWGYYSSGGLGLLLADPDHPAAAGSANKKKAAAHGSAKQARKMATNVLGNTQGTLHPRRIS